MTTEFLPLSDTRYELPPDGITLVGYVVRRMHKTVLLAPVPALVQSGQTAEALAQVTLYAAGASASFGPAFYQPEFNPVGDVVAEPDPATGAVVTAKLESRSPHYRISYSVAMPDGSQFSGSEEITGTTVSLRGLGMPAPSLFKYNAVGGTYAARLAGLITSELIPGLFGRSRIRAHGALTLQDDAGNTGKLELARSGQARVSVTSPSGNVITRQMSFAGAPASK